MSSELEKILKNQASKLPRLPVPPLKQTMERYLKSVKPFVSDAEYKVTERYVKTFLNPGGDGEKLQKILEDRATKTENWLSEWWLKYAYLGNRSPLPQFCNTCFLFPMREFNQIHQATIMIASTLEFKSKIDANDIPMEKASPVPLDMSQYYTVFGSCRVPREKEDSLYLHDHYTPYITVAHNNHFFSVDVYDDAGIRLNWSQLTAQLETVVSQSREPAENPLGILTTENRDNWGRIYQKLVEADARNRESLDSIKSSLFLVSLDGPASEDEMKLSTDRSKVASFRMIHGGGSKSNSGNRWFDKTIQLIVGCDGEAGLNLEHTPAEAQPLILIMDFIEIYRLKQGDKDPLPPAPGKIQSPQKLEFVVPVEVQDAIEVAKTNIDKLLSKLELGYLKFYDYGSDFIKQQKLSPDSYLQMAIQLAFYRLHHVPGAQYESAMTRMFLHGRTETIRSCTEEAVAFVKLMCDPKASKAEKAAALRTAITSHKDYVMNAVSGQGVDRHLLGLRMAALENGVELPEVFLDLCFTRSAHMRLSTSQVFVTEACAKSLGYFAPLVGDGYGVVYNPRLSNSIQSCCTAYAENPETDTEKFCEAIVQSLHDMREILI